MGHPVGNHFFAGFIEVYSMCTEVSTMFIEVSSLSVLVQ